jgi:hypothetical protein
MTWNVGDRVETKPELAWVYDGTEKQGLMSKRRRGTVVEVPWAARKTGAGTLLVRWESLTQVPLKRTDWWTHTNFLRKLESENA